MAKPDFTRIERTNLIGYSPLEPKDLAAKIAAGCKPSQLPGDFVLIIEGTRDDRLPYVALITSAVCAIPYYVYQLNNRFVHGKNVFEVVELAKIPWKWNNNALNSIALLGFCLGNDSLHQDVQRAYPACIYYYCEEQLNIVKDTFPTDIFNSTDSLSLKNALQEYNHVCDRYYGDREVCLSLSAGYDSRVLLASLLKRGIKPIVGTEGSPDSEDVKIASAIAKDLGLEHRIIKLTENDFVNADIVEATSGEVLLNAAWGAFLFLQQVQFPKNMLHLAGTNGELFRTFYFDFGILCQIADRFPKLLLKQFFDTYLIYRQRQYKDFPIEAFLGNKQSLKSSNISDRCYQLSAITGRRFSDRLDYFYTYYRVRNYIGQGVGLYNLINLTSSPFLDYQVVTAGARLNRKYKLNNFFHQQILLDSYPQLMNYPVNGSSISTMSAERNFYWLKKTKNKSTGKSLKTRLMESELKDICYDSPYLDNFLDRKQRILAVENRVFAVFSFLVTMHFVGQKIDNINAKK